MSDTLEQASPDCNPSKDFAFELANFSSRLQYSSLPASAVEAAKINIFDTLICAVAGSSAAAIPEVHELVREWGGTPQASILVFGEKIPAHQAAFINGCMAHARDYDDTHDAAVLHAGVSVVPAALAAAELNGRPMAEISLQAWLLGWRPSVVWGWPQKSGLLRAVTCTRLCWAISRPP